MAKSWTATNTSICGGLIFHSPSDRGEKAKPFSCNLVHQHAPYTENDLLGDGDSACMLQISFQFKMTCHIQPSLLYFSSRPSSSTKHPFTFQSTPGNEIIMRPSKYTKDALESYVARNIFLGILQAGPIPKHVAFIMDGNRRYSRANGVPVAKGHYKGSQAAANVSRIQIPAYSPHHC